MPAERARARRRPTGETEPRGDELAGKHGVQSLEIGMALLRAMADGQRAMMLKDIAAAAGMPPSKAHRYLVSMIRAGLVEQDPATSRYDLGPFALNLGLAAFDRLDRIRLGLAAIAALRDEINQTTALAVWGNKGPVLVRWERPRRPITVNVLTGTVVELLSSATGRVFAAWLPRRTVAPLIVQEQRSAALPAELRTAAGIDALLADVRARGYALAVGYHNEPGIEAAAAPVFNLKDELTMALVVVGVQGALDLRPDGDTVASLLRQARALSRQLGASPDAGRPDAGRPDVEAAPPR